MLGFALTHQGVVNKDRFALLTKGTVAEHRYKRAVHPAAQGVNSRRIPHRLPDFRDLFFDEFLAIHCKLPVRLLFSDTKVHSGSSVEL